MSTEAITILVGVVCGIAAGIPTSVLLLVVLTRRERVQEEKARQDHPGACPPVVVIQGEAHHALPPEIAAYRLLDCNR